MWIPGEIGGASNEAHSEKSPRSQAGHTGDTPRGTHDSQGLSTTRSPTSSPTASGPNSTTSATTSCPSTCGSEKKPFIGLSGERDSSPKSRKICFESEPQIPVSRGLVTTQSESSGRASG